MSRQGSSAPGQHPPSSVPSGCSSVSLRIYPRLLLQAPQASPNLGLQLYHSLLGHLEVAAPHSSASASCPHSCFPWPHTHIKERIDASEPIQHPASLTWFPRVMLLRHGRGVVTLPVHASKGLLGPWYQAFSRPRCASQHATSVSSCVKWSSWGLLISLGY